MLRFAAAFALFAGVSEAASTDYHPIDGAYAIVNDGGPYNWPGDGVLGHCNMYPRNTPAEWDPDVGNNPCHSVLGPETDLGQQHNYACPAPLPESLMLSLADLNKAEHIVSGHNVDHYNNFVQWYPRTNSSVSKKTTYFHKTRCGVGHGTLVKTDKNVYKRCEADTPAAGSAPQVNNTYHLPANVCLQTCDGQESCIGYTIDEAGAYCAILEGNASYNHGFPGYQLVGKNTETHISNSNGSAMAKSKKAGAINAASDFFAIDGVYYGHGNSGVCVRIDNGTTQGCPHRFGPEIDQQAQLIYPSPRLPEDTLLALADLNKAEQLILRPDPGAVPPPPGSGLRGNHLIWYPRSNSTVPQQTTYIHKTRCGDGIQGERIVTDKNAYKKCKNNKNFMGLKNAFNLPPNLCKSTCQSDADCAGYTIDTTDAHCWILNMTNDHGPVSPVITSYWLIGPLSG
jgi:hypothetical protein